MKTCVPLVVAAAAFASMFRPAQAATQTPPTTTTIAGTCQAAHDADMGVSVSFCSNHLRAHRSSIKADTRGLAETAAAVGVGNADAARYEIETLLSRRRDEGDNEEDGLIYRRALERCDRLYGMVRKAYAAAREAIAEQRYGDVERELSNVPLIAHSCDDGFTEARSDGAPPLLLYGVDNTQITLLTLAITSLIK